MINIYSPDRQEYRRVDIEYMGCIDESPGNRGQVMLGRIKLPSKGITSVAEINSSSILEMRITDQYELPHDKTAIAKELKQGQAVTLVLKPQHHQSRRDEMFPDGKLETIVDIITNH